MRVNTPPCLRASVVNSVSYLATQQIDFVPARPAAVGERAFGQPVDELPHQRIVAVRASRRGVPETMNLPRSSSTMRSAMRKARVHLVRDDDAGDAELVVQVDDELVDLGAGDRVEAGARARRRTGSWGRARWRGPGRRASSCRRRARRASCRRARAGRPARA